MEKKGVGRPRDGNPEETRKEILRAAGEAFAEAGFVGATTRAVAARAGVNVATLHYHFGSKEGLYRAVLRDASSEPLPAVPPGSAEETIRNLVEALFDYGAARPTLSRLALLDTLAGPQADEGESRDRRVGWLAEGLRPLLPPGNGRPAPSPGERARAILALVDAAFVSVGRWTSRGGETGEPEMKEPVPVPDEAARRAVEAAARRLTGLG